jgi:hypothetical protein
MPQTTVQTCQWPDCQHDTPPPAQELHRQMHVVLSRLDAQQRRWYAALEATRLGRGGERLRAHITGLDPQTSRRGRRSSASAQLRVSARQERGVSAPKKRPPDCSGPAGEGRACNRRGSEARAKVGAQPRALVASPTAPRWPSCACPHAQSLVENA